MKKIYCLTFSILLLASAGSSAQDLAAMVAKLQETVVPVEASSKSYTPKITFIQPAVVRYSYDEVDQKGNRTNYAYEFNLSDIDPYAVREQTQKDIIQVVMAVRNKQKLVKFYKNEVVQAYDEQAAIVAKDIENARAISDIVKKAIAPAEKVMAGRLKISGYDAMVGWLSTNVKNVDLGTRSFKQSLAKADKVGSMRFTQVEADQKSSTEEVYTFNLADVNVNSIAYKITGNKFAISFETLQKARYISLRKNGEVKPYVNEITINTNSVDEARDLKTVLALAAPLAVEKVKADMGTVSSDKDALQRIKTLTAEVSVGNKQIAQELDPQCVCTFTQVEKDPKTTEKNVFKFSWVDINAVASKIDVAGDRMYVDLAVNDNKKLVMHTRDEKFNGYDNEVKLYVPDVERARRLKFAIDKAVEKCTASFKEPFGADANPWIRANVKNVSLDEITVNQALEPVEAGNNNKLKYTRKEINSKGSGAEEVYEFNLSDLNPLSVEVEIKGKWLYVTAETEFKGKIIKYYKDGKIQPYASTIQFAINDVEIGRSMVSALRKSIKALKK
ncbi:hypothetical protein KK083_29165 [Fulvivirgaceae bacterium PWU4]|uniref:Uncharacterized protein n=1 Tax=Chryseosolibacter histidini TaxID=2782349 RepID=A0AAP2DT25_9BACT|nr:hypothetical protein [Chryseosolibacter histidini]MBT1700999.1 hypothetical protein [Chryseosolibacter histidini]